MGSLYPGGGYPAQYSQGGTVPVEIIVLSVLLKIPARSSGVAAVLARNGRVVVEAARSNRIIALPARLSP